MIWRSLVLTAGLVLGPEQTERAAEPEASAPVVIEPNVVTKPRGPEVAEAVLPSGLRALASQDTTLPVAAVVLTIEVGTEDDPPELPGLVHALAYQLLLGNRELAPLAIAEIAHDAGGVTSLAIGPGQVRYESLIPVSVLEDLLWAESQRLRAPTVNDALWKRALRMAERDGKRKWPVARKALAVAHDVEALADAGRGVNEALRNLEVTDVEQHLADLFRYERATLVVVSPLDPQAQIESIRSLLADLPPRPRATIARSRTVPSRDAPGEIHVDGETGDRMVFPLGLGNDQRTWAEILCRTLRRQSRIGNEPNGARVRCALEPDPRRGVLVVRAVGTDRPIELIRNRLERIARGKDDRLVRRIRQRAIRELAAMLGRPLPLARRLATGQIRTPVPVTTEGATARDRDRLTGLAAVRDGELKAAASRLLDVRRGWHLVPPEDGS